MLLLLLLNRILSLLFELLVSHFIHLTSVCFIMFCRLLLNTHTQFCHNHLSLALLLYLSCLHTQKIQNMQAHRKKRESDTCKLTNQHLYSFYCQHTQTTKLMQNLCTWHSAHENSARVHTQLTNFVSSFSLRATSDSSCTHVFCMQLTQLSPQCCSTHSMKQLSYAWCSEKRTSSADWIFSNPNPMLSSSTPKTSTYSRSLVYYLRLWITNCAFDEYITCLHKRTKLAFASFTILLSSKLNFIALVQAETTRVLWLNCLPQVDLYHWVRREREIFRSAPPI